MFQGIGAALLTLGPGGTGSATVTVASPPDAPAGFYTIPVAATNAGDARLAGTASATVT